jgi:hypothetical protein
MDKLLQSGVDKATDTVRQGVVRGQDARGIAESIGIDLNHFVGEALAGMSNLKVNLDSFSERNELTRRIVARWFGRLN